MPVDRSMEPLHGVALITGAARRIGAAIACRLHAAGMNVVVHCRSSREAADALAAHLCELRPDSAVVVVADLARLDQIDALAEAAYRRWDRLDVLVNNASTYHRTPLGSISESVFDDLVASNFKAPLFLIQACRPWFAEAAVAINLLDTLSRRAHPGFAPYIAAKAALWSVTETLAVELAPAIRVNGVALGYILPAETRTVPMADQQSALGKVPAGGMGDAEDVARAVHFLVAPGSRFLTGAILAVDGGLRLS